MPDFTDVPPARILAPAELMRRHGAGGRCPICDLVRCPTYVAARTEDVTDAARPLDDAVWRSYGEPWSGAGPVDVGLHPRGIDHDG